MIERLAASAMGTRFELVLVETGRDTPAARRRLRAAGAAALELIETCDARWSAFRRDSLVSRIRREGAHTPVRVDEATYFLLEAALELWRSTEGAFDVGLGGPMEALGFRARAARRERFEAIGGVPPLALDAGARSVRTTRPGALLDLGGVAKGCALDLAARELRDCGVECALLHGGTSSVVAIGAPPSGAETNGWRVAIEAPGEREAELVAVLCDTSLSVSAPHGRTAQAGGHVLDPRSGRAVQPGTSACVVAPDGLSADALATALVAGAWTRQNPLPLPPRTAAAVAGVDERRWILHGATNRVLETLTHQTS